MNARRISVREERGGFTLIELLVVIAIIGILAALLLPVLSKAKAKAQGIACINNNKQLMLSWYLYSDENQGWICPTAGTGLPPTYPNNWVLGTVSDQPPVNLSDIQNGLLFRYAKNVGLYKCPADHRTVNYPATSGAPTLRSMSMNAWMNPQDTQNLVGQAPYRLFRKQSDISRPALIWVTIDESPGSINDGWFVVSPKVNPTTWVDIPASYHNGAGGLSFADGHAQIKKWKDPVVLRLNSPINTPQTPGITDLQWLQDLTTTTY